MKFNDILNQIFNEARTYKLEICINEDGTYKMNFLKSQGPTGTKPVSGTTEDDMKKDSRIIESATAFIAKKYNNRLLEIKSCTLTIKNSKDKSVDLTLTIKLDEEEHIIKGEFKAPKDNPELKRKLSDNVIFGEPKIVTT